MYAFSGRIRNGKAANNRTDPQLFATCPFDAHLFVVARLESQLAGLGERPSLLRPSRACLRYRPLLPGSSNLGEGRGPRDSLLPGRTGGDISRLASSELELWFASRPTVTLGTPDA